MDFEQVNRALGADRQLADAILRLLGRGKSNVSDIADNLGLHPDEVIRILLLMSEFGLVDIKR